MLAFATRKRFDVWEMARTEIAARWSATQRWSRHGELGWLYPHPPGDLYGCENKGVARKGIRKMMKTKGEQICFGTRQKEFSE